MLRVRTSAARNTGIEVRRKGKKGRRNFMPVKITIKTSALCTIKMKLSFFFCFRLGSSRLAGRPVPG